jgi:hypothetical protein
VGVVALGAGAGEVAAVAGAESDFDPVEASDPLPLLADAAAPSPELAAAGFAEE